MAEVRVFPDVAALATVAAGDAAAVLRDAIAVRGRANLMLASGTSQLAFLDALGREPGIAWAKVTGFHMDEYVGMHADHPASFARYMRERFVSRVRPGTFHYLDGAALDPAAEAVRYAGLLQDFPLDLCCLGIGENGHLAFNDPPAADFDDPLDVKVVVLDDACKRQQVGEGHFRTVEDVPPLAITVTIPALLRARRLVVIVPEQRKAEPVRAALRGPVTTACPASILQRAANATMYLDIASASLLEEPSGGDPA